MMGIRPGACFLWTTGRNISKDVKLDFTDWSLTLSSLLSSLHSTSQDFVTVPHKWSHAPLSNCASSQRGGPSVIHTRMRWKLSGHSSLSRANFWSSSSLSCEPRGPWPSSMGGGAVPAGVATALAAPAAEGPPQDFGGTSGAADSVLARLLAAPPPRNDRCRRALPARATSWSSSWLCLAGGRPSYLTASAQRGRGDFPLFSLFSISLVLFAFPLAIAIHHALLPPELEPTWLSHTVAA